MLLTIKPDFPQYNESGSGLRSLIRRCCWLHHTGATGLKQQQ
jgi:hypothetical protein